MLVGSDDSSGVKKLPLNERSIHSLTANAPMSGAEVRSTKASAPLAG